MSIMNINKLLTTVNYENTNNASRVKYIVIHYVGATGGAKDNCLYFQNTYRAASAHYFVGHNGEIWQCVDDADVAWHCGTNGTYKHASCRNANSIGIEMCCRQGADGKWYFEDATVSSTIELTKMLMKKYNVPASNVIRHYDVTGKTCPEPYVTNRTKHTWSAFKNKLTSTPAIESTRKISGYNVVRQTDFLVVYNKGSRTGTNKWGTEVAVNNNGTVVASPVYGVGNMPIPSGCYVISGHGASSDWIKNNIKKGDGIDISGGVVKIGKAVPVVSADVDFSIGDEVKLASGAKYTSGATIPGWLFGTKLYVRDIQGSNIVFSTVKTGAVTGVVNKKYLTRYSATSGSVTTAPTSTSTTSALKVGDKVKMKNNAPIYGQSYKFQSWVYNSTLYVREIHGSRVVVSTQKTGAVTGSVDKKYLTKI